MNKVFLKIVKPFWLDFLIFFLYFFAATVSTSTATYLLSEIVSSISDERFQTALRYFSGFFTIECLIVFCEYKGNMVQANLEQRICVQLRNQIADKMLKCSIGKFEEKGKEQFLKEQLSSLSLFSEEYLGPFFNAVYFFLLLICSCVMLSMVYAKLAFAMILAIFLSCVVTRFYCKAIEKTVENYIAIENCHMEKILDIFSGFLDIYCNQIRKRFCILVKSQGKRYEKAACRYHVKMKGIATVVYLPTFLADMGILALIVNGMMTGEARVDALVAYINIGGLILNCGESLFEQISRMKGGLSALPAEVICLENVLDDGQPNLLGGLSISNSTLFSIDNLSFHYPNKNPITIRSLQIRMGHKYLLEGENGCGKSTLLKLLLRQLTPQEGEVNFCGCPINGFTEEELYQKIGYLPQAGYLFHGTVYENIFFDRSPAPDTEQILEICGLEEFVKIHSMGHIIEANGANLSGGERQRILLARLMVQGKQIILLDEPCAGIDKLLAGNIEQFFLAHPSFTVVMVSHDLQNRNKYNGLLETISLECN